MYSVAKGVPPEIENDPRLRKAIEQVGYPSISFSIACTFTMDTNARRHPRDCARALERALVDGIVS